MGLYDTVIIGDQFVQIKCWGQLMRDYRMGDEVPDLDNRKDYSIALREGGYLNVTNLCIDSRTDSPLYPLTVFDKYGEYVDAENPPQAFLGGPYLFSELDGDKTSSDNIIDKLTEEL